MIPTHAEVDGVMYKASTKPHVMCGECVAATTFGLCADLPKCFGSDALGPWSITWMKDANT